MFGGRLCLHPHPVHSHQDNILVKEWNPKDMYVLGCKGLKVQGNPGCGFGFARMFCC